MEPITLPATDVLTLAVNGVTRSPACWSAPQLRQAGFEPPRGHICPDSATFDFWVERPGTGWYEMCERAGFDGYDGTHRAWAIELDDAWLSWDQSSDSLSARLRRYEWEDVSALPSDHEWEDE